MTTKRKSSTKAKTASKGEESKKSKPATNGRKKPTTAKSKAKSAKSSTNTSKKIANEAEVDSKVREIISKSVQKVKSDESEKKESRAFTLDDVRSILSSKNKSSRVEKKEEIKTTKVKKTSRKGASTKVKKLTTASVDDIFGFGTGISAVPSKPIRDPKKVPKQWQVYYDDLMD